MKDLEVEDTILGKHCKMDLKQENVVGVGGGESQE